jgi:nicotinamidase-related amidase
MALRKIAHDSGSAHAAKSLRNLGVGLLVLLDACSGVAVTQNSSSVAAQAAQTAAIVPVSNSIGCDATQAASAAPTIEQCTPHLSCAP